MLLETLGILIAVLVALVVVLGPTQRAPMRSSPRRRCCDTTYAQVHRSTCPKGGRR